MTPYEWAKLNAAAVCEIESLRASLTRVEEERDRLQETLDAIESAAEDRRFD